MAGVSGPAQAGDGNGLFSGKPRPDLIEGVAPGRGNIKHPPFEPRVEFPDEADQVVFVHSVVWLTPEINMVVVGLCCRNTFTIHSEDLCLQL